MKVNGLKMNAGRMKVMFGQTRTEVKDKWPCNHSYQPSHFWRNYPAFLMLTHYPNREFHNSAFCPVMHNTDSQAAESVNCELK